MNSKLLYEPILPNSRDWPIIKMYQQKAAFLEAVSNKSLTDIVANQADMALLRSELSKALANEQVRLQKLAWKVDKKQDKEFWPAKLAALQQEAIPLSKVIKEITHHYAHEIVGGFNLWHYRLGYFTTCYTFNKHVNLDLGRRSRKLAKIQSDLQGQIEVVGSLDMLRQLAQVGTVVIVPTHCSHLDSFLIWWIIYILGLPPFIYGAGRNLFNSAFLGYFMNGLGAYKLDRRKKNVAYLTTLKAYSSMALHWGCHTLFYPGGTRSRSGALEDTLKLGLLGTALEAQQMNYQAEGPHARKVFIVPVVFNYHCVLEAPFLIRDYLSSKGAYVIKKDKKRFLYNSYRILKLIKEFATKGSSLAVSIGQPVDVVGNLVDEIGQSYDSKGLPVNLYDVLRGGHESINTATPILKEYTKDLSNHILKAYSRENCVLTSYLLAFVAFQVVQKNNPDKIGKDLFMSQEPLIIKYGELELAINKVKQRLLGLESESKIRLSGLVKSGTPADIIQHGLANLGLYHSRVPLVQDKERQVVVNDICNLFFYHNRLTGYELEKCIS